MEIGLELGGTITGEHGVGVLKRTWLVEEIGPVAIDVHRAIKTALDPKNLLNPGQGRGRVAAVTQPQRNCRGHSTSMAVECDVRPALWKVVV